MKDTKNYCGAITGLIHPLARRQMSICRDKRIVTDRDSFAVAEDVRWEGPLDRMRSGTVTELARHNEILT